MGASNVMGLVVAIICIALITIGLKDGRIPTTMISVAPGRKATPFGFWVVVMLYGFAALAGLSAFLSAFPGFSLQH